MRCMLLTMPLIEPGKKMPVFGDAVFGWDCDFFGDGTKARRLGFHEFVDAGQMFFELFGELKAKKVIPL